MCRFGEDHRSLTDVLQDLQGQLKGQEPKLLPGQTLSRPLHVILQVSLQESMLLIGSLTFAVARALSITSLRAETLMLSSSGPCGHLS